MEKLNPFNNSTQIENSYKMELEKAHNIKHSNMIKKVILSKRINSVFPFNQKFQNDTKINTDTFNSNLILNNINEILALLNKLQNIPSFNNKTEFDSINKSLMEKLKQIRKELIKENISMVEAKNILNDKTQNFIIGLLSKDTFDPYIQLESLWIINNLMFLVAKYNNCYSFDVKNISNYLIQYLINIYKTQKNEGVKYTLEEKILRIFGNIIHINNRVIELLINNQIITFIIDSLNSPVPSLRTTCLWLINKIILNLRKLESTNYINMFTTKNAISNYKFILTRLENLHSFDEIGELFWLFNELVKYEPSILISIFFSDVIDSNNLNSNNNGNNLFYFNKDFTLKNFEFILNNCLTMKMFQTSFRLISNLLIVCLNHIKNEELLIKLIEILFQKQGILRFINDVLNSPKNKYDISLVKDILLLIFNLICLSPTKSCVLFKNGIVNLIDNKDYQNDNEIMKLLFYIYYRILISKFFLFEPNDEKVIKIILVVMERFLDDVSIIIIFFDLFYFYLKASHTKISEDLEKEIQSIVNSEQNIPRENYKLILLKMTNFVKIHSSLSKFMKNL